MGIMLLINGVIKAFTELSQAAEKVRQKAQELGSEFKDSKSDIESYKKQIKELHKTINDSTSSIEDVTNARKTLMSVQDELIEKFGTEKNVINDITDAINGQTEAFDILIQRQWQEAKNKFNDSDLWNDFLNWRDGYDTNIDRMIGEMEDVYVGLNGLDMKYVPLIQALKDAGYDYFTYGESITLHGNLNQVYEDILKIQQITSEYDAPDFFLKDLTNEANKAKETIDKYSNMWDQYILQERIFASDTLAESFNEINKAYSNYQDAFVSGDKQAIEEALAIYAGAVNTALDNAGTDESVKEYFNNMYPALQSAVAEWNFNVAFDANTDDLQDKVQSALDGLRDENGRQLTTEEILGLDKENEQYRELKSIADSYNMTLEEMIALLKERNLVADMDYQGLVSLFGQENIDSLTSDEIEIAYQIKNVGNLTFDELKTEIVEIQNKADEPIEFDITTHKDSIDDFQSKLKTLGDALASIRSGDFENSDLADLLQEFPELADKTDDLETAIIELINNALQALYDTLGENIPDDLKTSLQELADIASGTAKHLGDAFSDIHDSWDILHDFKDTMDKGFDSNVTDSLLQSVRKLSGELETLVAGYYSGVVSAEQLYEALTQHYENDLHNYSEALIKKNELNEEFYNAVGLASEEVTNQFMDDYDVDLKNCKTYAEAKERIELQTLQKISGAWHQYYDAQSQTLKMSMSEIEARATHGGTDAAEFLEQYNNYLAAMEALNNITYEGLKSNFEGIGSKLGANGSGSGSSSDFEETFDWIETAIDRIERSISNLGLKASSVYRSWSERNSNLKAELLDVKKEMDIQASGYNKYMQQANSVGLSEEWASKVRNGQIDINSITDKALAEQIKQYQDYYEKALKCQDAVEDLRESVSKLYETAFDNIVSQFDSILSVIENSKSMLDEQINQAEERGYIANVAYYEALIKVEQKNIEQLTKERTTLQSALADAVSNGAIAEGSQEWADMVKQINDVTLSIEQANTAMIKYGNSIRDIQWQIFDLIQDRISRISSESDFLINLLSYDKQYDDRGQLTDAGMSTVGLHGMNYNVYMAQADKYAEEMLRIDKELAEDPYNQDLYNRRQELLELQQEMIIAAEDEKQAIVDMVEEGINLELNALKELIDTYTEALDAQKDLYDYQKNIAKQTEEIASLQKQLSAYEGDLSEEARQKVQQIKVSLENAQEQLEETEYEHYISDQKKLLDDLYLEYETALNQRLDNIDALIADMIASSNANAGMISDTLSSKAESVGYYLSESIEDIWNTNTGSMLDALAMYDSNIMGGFAEVNTSVGEVIRGVTETVSGIGNVNSTINNAINSVTGNMQAILDKLSAISTMQSASAASSYYGGSGGTSSSGNSSGTDSSGNGSSSSGGSGGSGFFIYSKDSYPKNKLNKDTSIIDRLRYFDFDYSFNSRKLYYSKMGLSGTYTGTDSQNAQMLNWMKLNGYKNGVYNLKRDELAWTQEGGKAEVILNPDGSITRPDGSVLTPLRQGDSVLNADATKNLYSFMNNPQAFIRGMGLNNIPVSTQKATSIDMGGVEFTINAPNATNWEEIKQDIMKDRQFTKFVQTITVGEATGGSIFKKYHV